MLYYALIHFSAQCFALFLLFIFSQLKQLIVMLNLLDAVSCDYISAIHACFHISLTKFIKRKQQQCNNDRAIEEGI